MKTLVLNGSPRKNGNTVFLIDMLKEYLEGEVHIVDTYTSSIRPCSDCRYCWSNPGCCIQDKMQELYEYIKICDNIVIASPIYFTELTGSLLLVCSRLQTFYASERFFNIRQLTKQKLGAILLCAGSNGPFDKAANTARVCLKTMNATVAGTVFSSNTDEVSSQNNENVIQQIRQLAIKINDMNRFG